MAFSSNASRQASRQPGAAFRSCRRAGDAPKEMLQQPQVATICSWIGKDADAIRMSLEQAENQMSQQIDDWNVFWSAFFYVFFYPVL